MIKRLSKIKIQDSFKRNPPKWTKMLDKQAFYIENGRFEQPIIIDEEGYLIDGYTTYILCKTLNKKLVRVKRR